MSRELQTTKEWYVSGCGRFIHHIDDADEFNHETEDWEFLSEAELYKWHFELFLEINEDDLQVLAAYR